jgi:hypothetical protein
LREERGLRVFDNRVLSGIFGPKRDEVTRDWRKLHIEDLNDLKTEKNEMGEEYSTYGGEERYIQGFGGET